MVDAGCARAPIQRLVVFGARRASRLCLGTDWVERKQEMERVGAARVELAAWCFGWSKEVVQSQAVG